MAPKRKAAPGPEETDSPRRSSRRAKKVDYNVDRMLDEAFAGDTTTKPTKRKNTTNTGESESPKKKVKTESPKKRTKKEDAGDDVPNKKATRKTKRGRPPGPKKPQKSAPKNVPDEPVGSEVSEETNTPPTPRKRGRPPGPKKQQKSAPKNVPEETNTPHTPLKKTSEGYPEAPPTPKKPKRGATKSAPPQRVGTDIPGENDAPQSPTRKSKPKKPKKVYPKTPVASPESEEDDDLPEADPEGTPTTEDQPIEPVEAPVPSHRVLVPASSPPEPGTAAVGERRRDIRREYQIFRAYQELAMETLGYKRHFTAACPAILSTTINIAEELRRVGLDVVLEELADSNPRIDFTKTPQKKPRFGEREGNEHLIEAAEDFDERVHPVCFRIASELLQGDATFSVGNQTQAPLYWGATFTISQMNKTLHKHDFKNGEWENHHNDDNVDDDDSPKDIFRPSVKDMERNQATRQKATHQKAAPEEVNLVGASSQAAEGDKDVKSAKALADNELSFLKEQDKPTTTDFIVETGDAPLNTPSRTIYIGAADKELQVKVTDKLKAILAGSPAAIPSKDAPPTEERSGPATRQHTAGTSPVKPKTMPTKTTGMKRWEDGMKQIGRLINSQKAQKGESVRSSQELEQSRTRLGARCAEEDRLPVPTIDKLLDQLEGMQRKAKQYLRGNTWGKDDALQRIIEHTSKEIEWARKSLLTIERSDNLVGKLEGLWIPDDFVDDTRDELQKVLEQSFIQLRYHMDDCEHHIMLKNSRSDKQSTPLERQ